MSAEVKRLPTAANEESLLPEFEIGIAMNLGGERQITLRSPVREQISGDEANARMDGLMRVAERQRSLIEIRGLEDELTAKTDALEKVWKVRKAEAEEKHKAKLAELEKAVVEATRRHEAGKVSGAERWDASGRKGPYLPENDNRLKRLADDRQTAISRIGQAETEHLQHVQTIDGNIEKLEGELREINRQLERHRAIVAS